MINKIVAMVLVFSGSIGPCLTPAFAKTSRMRRNILTLAYDESQGTYSFYVCRSKITSNKCISALVDSDTGEPFATDVPPDLSLLVDRTAKSKSFQSTFLSSTKSVAGGIGGLLAYSALLKKNNVIPIPRNIRGRIWLKSGGQEVVLKSFRWSAFLGFVLVTPIVYDMVENLINNFDEGRDRPTIKALRVLAKKYQVQINPELKMR